MNQFVENNVESSSLSNASTQLSYSEIKRPRLPFISFCKIMFAINKDTSNNTAITTKELNNMWTRLPEINKKKFFDNYQLEKKEYEKQKEYLTNIKKEKIIAASEASRKYKTDAKIKKCENDDIY